MKTYDSLTELLSSMECCLDLKKGACTLTDKNTFTDTIVDRLAYTMAVSNDQDVRSSIAYIMWESAQQLGIHPSSIHEFYESRGRGAYSGLTVPAINIRGLTYMVARTIIKTAIANETGPFIFEIAKSEIGYTAQRPVEYATLCIAAAIREGFSGPIFIQGDHFQAKASNYFKEPEKEIDGLKALIKEAIEAGFYNIDIDSSTLVDLSKQEILEQQRNNFEVAAALTKYIRGLEPDGVTVSVGGEIGEVGKKNSTPEELRAFMQGYNDTLKRLDGGMAGISKISVQTGTSHGGVVLPDGSIAKVNLDFDTLATLSKLAREEFGMSGAVQHGASTLPNEAFHRFPETETAEVHLATGFQNIIYDHPALPASLRDTIYGWMKSELAKEWKEGWTEDQFIYKTRKKGFGPFKRELLDLPEKNLGPIREKLEQTFDFLFHKLNVTKTRELVAQHMTIHKVGKPRPACLK
ncbi:MAG: class II fructose-bisphosphate aldolase [bacterium]